MSFDVIRQRIVIKDHKTYNGEFAYRDYGMQYVEVVSNNVIIKTGLTLAGKHEKHDFLLTDDFEEFAGERLPIVKHNSGLNEDQATGFYPY